MKRPLKVLLCGYYGMGNLGDELLARASIRQLERCGIPKEQIVMLSGDPRESRRRFGVEAVDRWSLSAIVKCALRSESLLLGGGGIFQDATSVKSVVYYWMVLTAARLCGCTLWAAGQSVGPLRHRLSRFLTRFAFSLCGKISVRDRHSEVFFSGACERTEDLALTLFSRKTDGLHRKGYALFNVRPFDGKLEREAAAAWEAYAALRGLETVGVAMSPADAELMEELCRQGTVHLQEILTPKPEEVSELFSGASCAFGMRLHFCVLALCCGVPCQSVPYDPKVKDFSLQWGIPQWKNAVCFHSPADEENRLAEASKHIEDFFRRGVKECAGLVEPCPERKR